MAHRSGFEGEGEEEDFQVMKENSLAETEEKTEVGNSQGHKTRGSCVLSAPGAVGILGFIHFCPQMFSHNSGHGKALSICRLSKYSGTASFLEETKAVREAKTELETPVLGPGHTHSRLRPLTFLGPG